jgi:phosphate transport system substrate-binding protein
MLQNKAGKFVLSSKETVSAAVAATADKTPTDERLSLIFADGDNSYPIINFEYAIVKQQQPSPDMAAAVREFLEWAIKPDGGNSAQYLDQVGFVPLPPAIAKLSATQLASIK